MANPMFTDSALQRAGAVDAPAAPPGFQPMGAAGAATAPAAAAPYAARRTEAMTIGGTCSATGAMLAVLVVGAWFGWTRVTETTVDTVRGRITQVDMPSPGWLVGALVVGLGLALFTAFKPTVARFTALPYALAEGVLLGVISHLYDAQSQGIAIQAVIATIGVFATMLLLYGLRVLRATPKFTKAVVAATVGVAAIYLVALVVRLFGGDLGIFDSTSGLSILFSVVVVGIAAMNLILDFDFIERGTAAGLPKSMEWYGAFGLVVTVVWLYLELLRLLSKLNRR
jgi:uncharacterized YccA/Bax inhibitor family protein